MRSVLQRLSRWFVMVMATNALRGVVRLARGRGPVWRALSSIILLVFGTRFLSRQEMAREEMVMRQNRNETL
ncbi:MAG: hypothetical protein SF029_08565 [bacterium]|nr:hypothetical protein [bacterium]